jgi:hypothetical protein
MSRVLDRRLLGPVKTIMGGQTTGSAGAGGGGGGSSITITNNVDGHLLTATGGANTIEGMAQTAFPANSKLSGSYTAGTGNQGLIGDFSALYFDGVNHEGVAKRYQLVISGGMLQTKEL